MAKHADFIRAVPGGTAVASNAVTLKLHVDDSTWQSGTTDAAGLYAVSEDGSPGPIYETSTVGSTTKKRSGKSTGQVGVWWLADHPAQMRALGTGVVPSYTDQDTTAGDMAVSPGSGLQVLVAEGLVFIDGNVYHCTASTGLTVTANSSGSTRIDRIIIRYTREGQTEEGKCELLMLDGTAGSGIPTALTNSSSAQEFSLAKLTVVNGAASFSSGDITDERYDTTLNQAYAFKWPTGLRNGDLFYISNGKLTRLAVGTSNQVLTSSGTAPQWSSSINVAAIPTAIPATSIGTGTVSNTEFGYLDGVTSALQTQLTAKAPKADPTFTGTITGANLEVNSIFTQTIDASTHLTGDVVSENVQISNSLTLGDPFQPDPSGTNTPVGTYPAAGTSPGSVTVSGSDYVGRLSFVTGSSPSTGDMVKVVFGTAQSDTNFTVVVQARSNNASTLAIKVTESTTGFTINAPSSAPAASATYQWGWHLIRWA